MYGLLACGNVVLVDGSRMGVWSCGGNIGLES
jgi:hypothetical protein